jgi:hypothetical protein
MATPIDLLDPTVVMAYSGLVDASTAKGQVDEADDWCGAVAAMLSVNLMGGRTAVRARRLDRLETPRHRTAPLRKGAEWRYARVRRLARAPQPAAR